MATEKKSWRTPHSIDGTPDDLLAATGSNSPGTTKRWERTQSEVYLKGKGAPAVDSNLESSMSGSDQALNDHISEHTKVYWDLPGAVEDNNMARPSPRGNMKFTLQTIHQKEELKNDPFPSVGYGPAAYSNFTKPTTSTSSKTGTSSGTFETTGAPSSRFGGGGTIYSVYEQQSGPGTIRITKRQSSFETMYPPEGMELPPPASVTLTKESTVQVFDKEVSKMKNFIVQLKSDSANEQTNALDDILTSLISAWTTPQYGRSLAYTLCDALRDEGGLKTIINNCDSEIYDILLGSAKVLSQCLTNPNREYLINENGLSVVVRMSNHHRNDAILLAATTGILEGLFKHSQTTCRELVNLGGLSLMLFSCRSVDKCTLRNCAMALANLALYGGEENHEKMIAANVPDWLFPLAFSHDDVVKYYACMAICALTVNKELAPLIQKSGTMALVEPFIIKHSPATFARNSSIHFQGKADDWLKRLVPMLKSESRPAQSLAAFHFAMEASVKAEQKNLKVLYDIGAVNPLKEVAVSPNKLASRFACDALQVLGEQIPYTLSSQVPLWSITDVQNWIQQIGFSEYKEVFSKLMVDGDILLSLTHENLKDDIGITNGISRQRFMRHLKDLKMYSDYTSCDQSRVCKWLTKVDPQLLKYAYRCLTAGLTMEMIPNITDEHLRVDCGIENGIHRLKIISAAEGNINYQQAYARSLDAIEGTVPSSTKQKLDVFISYRRSTGSQLASLLKVHLQLRGFTVFLDIEKLAAGKFDDRLLNSVKQARNFILVLTPGALERCMNDDIGKDWVHREIVAALNSDCNIVPVIDEFKWPASDQLPEDMRSVTRFNGVRWIHDYQDACVDKLESFLRGEQEALLTNKSLTDSTQKSTTMNNNHKTNSLNPPNGLSEM